MVDSSQTRADRREEQLRRIGSSLSAFYLSKFLPLSFNVTAMHVTRDGQALCSRQAYEAYVPSFLSFSGMLTSIFREFVSLPQTEKLRVRDNISCECMTSKMLLKTNYSTECGKFTKSYSS
jgi:hypothetical protein